MRANYLYAGAADLMLETGDKNLRTPLEAVWQNVVQKKMYITGACSALYDGDSPYGSKNQSSMTRVHQAYGHNYELPNTTAHGENMHCGGQRPLELANVSRHGQCQSRRCPGTGTL